MNHTHALRFSLGVLLATAAFAANAGLQLGCPVRWDLVGTNLSGNNLDADLFGVKVRDWKPEYLDQVLRKSEECSRSGPGPESVRRAEHLDGATRVYPYAKGLFAERDRRLQQEGLRNQVTASVQQANLKQVVTLDSAGLPQSIQIIYGPTGRETRTCNTLNQGIGYATAESYGQAVGFARLCQQAGRTESGTVAMLERQAAAVPALYNTLDAFAAQVKQVSNQTQVPDAKLKELAANRQRVEDQLKSLNLPNNDEVFVAAGKTLQKLFDQADGKACDAAYSKARMPAAWKDNYIIYQWNTPRRLLDVVCFGLRNGAQVRYLSGGIFSREGIEVKSPKRTVQLFTQVNSGPGGDPNVQILVPIAAKMGGQEIEVTRANLPTVAAALIAALENR